MDLIKKITVPVEINDSMLHTQKVEQEAEIYQIGEAFLGNSSFFIFSSENFFGHGVTAGVRVDDKNTVLKIYFKAALCSEEDRFNKHTGEEIVLGRLIKADAEEPNTMIEIKNLSTEEVSKTITSLITNFLSSLGKLIIKRDESTQLLKISEQLQKRTFKNAFSKYK